MTSDKTTSPIPFAFEEIGPLSREERRLLDSIRSIGQVDAVEPYLTSRERFDRLISLLRGIDKFYADFGGVEGYQKQVIKLLDGSKKQDQEMEFHPPEPVDIRQENDEVRHFVMEGIRHLGELCEMYAIGGAADRLGLADPISGEALPAAKLVIMRSTLLEHLLRDLFAREYLHYKLFGKQVMTPVALMTSHEKDNDTHVRNICTQNGWFGRDPTRFLFFCQPLVPTFTREGKWVNQEDELLLKPGGHGVIWKLAHQEGVLDRMEKLGCRKGFIRQINNPIAGIDYGLMAFVGIGFVRDQQFGFASCPRREKAKEGVNVMKKLMKEGKPVWSLSNIEYCDLKSESVSRETYPANTNILFVDLKSIKSVVEEHPYPGVLLNFKAGQQEEIARLELTMQNIADAFQHDEKEHPHAYLTINHREKTISAAKKAYVEGESLLETPEGCFIDIQKQAHALFSSCGMKLAEPVNSELETWITTPPSVISYHPGLGPLYSVVRQKIIGGSLSDGGEMRLEIADLRMENVDVRGSLIIETDAILGHQENGRVIFSDRTGKAILKNVKIENRGIDYGHEQNYVSGRLVHQQQCLISIGENALFIAEDVSLGGDFIVRVPSNTVCRARFVSRRVEFSFEPMSERYSMYQYTVEDDDRIQVEYAPPVS